MLARGRTFDQDRPRTGSRRVHQLCRRTPVFYHCSVETRGKAVSEPQRVEAQRMPQRVLYCSHALSVETETCSSHETETCSHAVLVETQGKAVSWSQRVETQRVESVTKNRQQSYIYHYTKRTSRSHTCGGNTREGSKLCPLLTTRQWKGQQKRQMKGQRKDSEKYSKRTAKRQQNDSVGRAHLQSASRSGPARPLLVSPQLQYGFAIGFAAAVGILHTDCRCRPRFSIGIAAAVAILHTDCSCRHP